MIHLVSLLRRMLRGEPYFVRKGAKRAREEFLACGVDVR
jgi:hypothetical protein